MGTLLNVNTNETIQTVCEAVTAADKQCLVSSVIHCRQLSQHKLFSHAQTMSGFTFRNTFFPRSRETVVSEVKSGIYLRVVCSSSMVIILFFNEVMSFNLEV